MVPVPGDPCPPQCHPTAPTPESANLPRGGRGAYTWRALAGIGGHWRALAGIGRQPGGETVPGRIVTPGKPVSRLSRETSEDSPLERPPTLLPIFKALLRIGGRTLGEFNHSPGLRKCCTMPSCVLCAYHFRGVVRVAGCGLRVAGHWRDIGGDRDSAQPSPVERDMWEPRGRWGEGLSLGRGLSDES